jgi:hypothetical protein
MLRLVADENFNGAVVRGLLRRQADLDIVRIQDVGLLGADDPTNLAWAASQSRILLSHDRATLPDFAYERVANGLPMPGMFVSSARLPIARIIEDILLLANDSEPSEWEGIVLHLPL